MWALDLYGIEQLLCDFEFLVLVLGHLAHCTTLGFIFYQMTEEECNTFTGCVPLTHFEVVM